MSGRQRIEHDIGPCGCQPRRYTFVDATPGSHNKDNFVGNVIGRR
jgi:hypothetical protein